MPFSIDNILLLAEMPGQTFHAFSLMHLISVLACIFITAVMVTIGFLTRSMGLPAFMLWRRSLGAVFLLLYIWYVIYFLFFEGTQGFSWDFSLPLMYCDVAMLMVSLAFLFKARFLRSLVFIWGIAFSSFAFVTPTLWLGPESMRFWLFWGIHVAIVGGAIHDMLVARFRIGIKDWVRVFIMSAIFSASLAGFNAFLHSKGYPANYGFLGNTTPEAATPFDYMGPYPWRILVICVVATILSLIVCSPFFIIRFVKGYGIMGGKDMEWEWAAEIPKDTDQPDPEKVLKDLAPEYDQHR